MSVYVYELSEKLGHSGQACLLENYSVMLLLLL